MIAMSTLHLLAAAQVNAERGAKEGRLDIVSHNCIAPKDHLHIATTNQVGHVSTCSRVNDGWPQHKENFTVVRARLFHLTSNLVDRQHLDLFRGDAALDKGKSISFTRALKWLHTNSIMAYDNLVTHLHFMHRPAKGTAFDAIDDDRDIHLGPLHIAPLRVHPHLCWRLG